MDTGRNKKADPTTSREVGRITIDSRGRNVWQWNDDQLDSTTIMLQRLDNSALALEPTRTVPKPDIEAESRKQAASSAKQAASAAPGRERRQRSESLEMEQTFNVKLGGGFDPYNRG